jgi:hypothetical protein
LAVAAIAASLLLTRSREQQGLTEGLQPAGEGTPAQQTLDAIRAAGL